MVHPVAGELERAVHETTIELLDYGGANAESIAEVICEERPDLLERYQRSEIENRAAALLVSDLPDESERFQGLFAEFNATYFGGSLPEYRVRVVYAIDLGGLDDEGHYVEPTAGFIDAQSREIRLRMSRDESLMIATLLHEMAHVATNGEHGTDWVAEMKRLHRLGAPVSACDLE